jgi:hypothetical protein
LRRDGLKANVRKVVPARRVEWFEWWGGRAGEAREEGGRERRCGRHKIKVGEKAM